MLNIIVEKYGKMVFFVQKNKIPVSVLFISKHGIYVKKITTDTIFGPFNQSRHATVVMDFMDKGNVMDPTNRCE